MGDSYSSVISQLTYHKKCLPLIVQPKFQWMKAHHTFKTHSKCTPQSVTCLYHGNLQYGLYPFELDVKFELFAGTATAVV